MVSIHNRERRVIYPMEVSRPPERLGALPLNIGATQADILEGMATKHAQTVTFVGPPIPQGNGTNDKEHHVGRASPPGDCYARGFLPGR